MQAVQRLAIGLFEVRNCAEHGLARQQAAGIGQHCGEGADPGRARRIDRGGGKPLERAQVAADFRLEPALQPLAQTRPGLRRSRSSARAVRSAGSRRERPGARRART